MLSSARLGAPFCVTGAALWRSLAGFVAGAAFHASGCVCVFAKQAEFGMRLKGLDVVESVAGGPVSRDRRSTLELACRFRGRRSIFFIWVEDASLCHFVFVALGAFCLDVRTLLFADQWAVH